MARTFSGKRIDLGNRFVRLVYLDEAGTSNPAQEPFLVVAGVIVQPDQDWLSIDRHLKSIMRKRLPEEMRFTGIFHAKDIWHGEKKFSRGHWPLPKRMDILADIAAVPKTFRMPVIHGWVQREAAARHMLSIQPSLPASTVANSIHATAFINAVGAVDRWMRHHAPNEVAMLIAEDAGKIKSALKMLQEGYRHDEVDSYFWELRRDYPKDVFKTRRIIDTIHFAPKGESPLLQIADTCAFVIKRQLKGCDDSKRQFSLFEPQMFLPLKKSGWPSEEQSS